MKDPEDLEGTAPRLIDDEVGENPVEKNVPLRKVGAPMAAIRDLGQRVKTLEEFGYDPIRRLYALLLQKVKPDGVNIEDGVLGKLKRV